MSTILRRREAWPPRAAGAVICSAIAAYSSIAIAQQSPPVPSENRSALPTCQVTFLLRTTALVVDTAWLHYGLMADFVASRDLLHSCPPQPVDIDNVWLSSAVLGVLKIKDLGHRDDHPDWLLEIRASPSDKDQPGTQPAPANRVRGQPVETTITMQKSGRGRTYDIEYLSPDATIAGRVRILCVDDRVNRMCHGPRAWFAGLMIDYNISQDEFPAPSEVSTDANTEPGAILQFDRNLRGWLIDLERPR